MRSLIDSLDGPAAAASTLVVPCCGFTVPSDLGAMHAVQLLGERHGTPARSVRSFVQFNGRLSGGTMSTGILLDTSDPDVQEARRDPFLLGGAPAGAEAAAPRAEDLDPSAAEYDADVGAWTAPFWMSDISSRVVRRSSALYRAASAASPGGGVGLAARVFAGGGGYDERFGYRERALAKDEGVARNLAAPTAPVSQRRRLIERGKLPKPGEGPSAEVRARSWFRVLMVAADAAGNRVLSSVRGGDPGYEETSKMVSEAAALLATRRDELPVGRAGGRAGGVLTPAFALGTLLRDELHARGVEFTEHELPAGEEEARAAFASAAAEP